MLSPHTCPCTLSIVYHAHLFNSVYTPGCTHDHPPLQHILAAISDRLAFVYPDAHIPRYTLNIMQQHPAWIQFGKYWREHIFNTSRSWNDSAVSSVAINRPVLHTSISISNYVCSIHKSQILPSKVSSAEEEYSSLGPILHLQSVNNFPAPGANTYQEQSCQSPQPG